LDKLDPYLRSLLHMLDNKPIEENKLEQSNIFIIKKLILSTRRIKKEKKIKLSNNYLK
jgi:hypothetical protein